jgi:hypothetical protein
MVMLLELNWAGFLDPMELTVDTIQPKREPTRGKNCAGIRWT